MLFLKEFWENINKKFFFQYLLDFIEITHFLKKNIFRWAIL